MAAHYSFTHFIYFLTVISGRTPIDPSWLAILGSLAAGFTGYLLSRHRHRRIPK